jgi:ABC-type branched-subunit amino acid transport system permease subunit
MSPEKSLEAVVWCAVGGRHTLIGPILGAISVNALKSYATWAFPEQWLYLLGGMFILVVLFMPKGLAGLPEQLRAAKARFSRRNDDTAPIAAVTMKGAAKE